MVATWWCDRGNGEVDLLKARLVAKGYTQICDLDHGDMFSLVAKWLLCVSSLSW